jgi:hypothetical protein
VWFAGDEEAKKSRGCSLGSNGVDGVKQKEKEVRDLWGCWRLVADGNREFKLVQ